MSDSVLEKAVGQALDEVLGSIVTEEIVEDMPVQVLTKPADMRTLGEALVRELEYQGYVVVKQDY
jgi:hypothetical protein